VRLINFILWLSVGAVIGWFARVMYEIEYLRHVKLESDEDPSS